MKRHELIVVRIVACVVAVGMIWGVTTMVIAAATPQHVDCPLQNVLDGTCEKETHEHE